MVKGKSILEMTETEARKFFLKGKNYCNIGLPIYFIFDDILKKIEKKISGKNLDDFKVKDHCPKNYENINYTLFHTKDGQFDWRPLELIHPVLYVSLVNKITEKDNWDSIMKQFQKFQSNKFFFCLSIPSDYEQEEFNKNEKKYFSNLNKESLKKSLRYKYLLSTDITNCYSSIYTHSISWAIHTKETAKKPENRNNNRLIGVVIEKHIQDMSHGQTNGIPQGSILMDFIAEILLGYADFKLSEEIGKLGIEDYEILRYRDDYRIFSNNQQTIESIAKLLTETLLELNFKLNTQKTFFSNSIIHDLANKKEFLFPRNIRDDTSSLLEIHIFSQKFPNSIPLNICLEDFSKQIEKKVNIEDLDTKISILIEIMLQNPNTYLLIITILGILLQNVEQKEMYFNLIKNKFKEISNTGYLDICLQRLSIKISNSIRYEEKLCKIVCEEINNQDIWNCSWLKGDILKIMNTKIIDKKKIKYMDSYITIPEYQLTKNKYFR